MNTLYAEIDGKWTEIKSTLSDIESTETCVELGATPLDSSGCEFTIPIVDGKALERAILPRGYRNMRILKRDGYLSPSNAEME